MAVGHYGIIIVDIAVVGCAVVGAVCKGVNVCVRPPVVSEGEPVKCWACHMAFVRTCSRNIDFGIRITGVVGLTGKRYRKSFLDERGGLSSLGSGN